MQYAHCPATAHRRDRAVAERSAYRGLQALARRRGLVQQSVGGMGIVIDGVGQRRVLRYEVRCVPARSIGVAVRTDEAEHSGYARMLEVGEII